MAVSGKTAAPHEVPYYLGTDKPPDMAAVTKAMADRLHLLHNKIQTKRLETPELAAGESKEVTITWPTAFADIAYTVSVSCLSEGLATGVTARWFKSKLPASIIVVVKNDSGSTLKGTINAIAIHD